MSVCYSSEGSLANEPLKPLGLFSVSLKPYNRNDCVCSPFNILVIEDKDV